MMYRLYGKRTAGKIIDKQFKALNSQGYRVNNLDEAMMFPNKEAGQTFIDNMKNVAEGAVFELRPVK